MKNIGIILISHMSLFLKTPGSWVPKQIHCEQVAMQFILTGNKQHFLAATVMYQFINVNLLDTETRIKKLCSAIAENPELAASLFGKYVLTSKQVIPEEMVKDNKIREAKKLIATDALVQAQAERHSRQTQSAKGFLLSSEPSCSEFLSENHLTIETSGLSLTVLAGCKSFSEVRDVLTPTKVFPALSLTDENLKQAVINSGEVVNGIKVSAITPRKK